MLTEAVLGGIADAVFGKAIELLDIEERLRAWLGRDPVKLAFQKALARAYTAFARQYPKLTASLFDESFLKTEAAPELARLLTRHLHPDPARLTELWGESFAPRVSTSPTDNALTKQKLITRHLRPASDFLHWLEAELKAEPVFQPLFDSRALESLPAMEAKLDELTRELRRRLDYDLSIAHDYEQAITQIGGVKFESISGSQITVGGSIAGRNIITNYYFSGGFSSLKDDYVPPDAVFQRVRVEEFVGRGWLVDKVDAFIHDPARKSGALAIVGEAGVGKTAFMAHLVKERGYPHLFADDVGGEAKLGLAIRSLAAQLISRYRIDPYARRDALPDYPVQFDTFLGNILRIAAGKSTAGEQIVVVCDALDEAGVAPGGNAFGLPKVVPDGVYFILSRRPASVPLSMEPRPETLELRATGDENLEDVREYLAGAARLPEIARQLKASGYGEEQFVDTLSEKSSGVWMYLKYVLTDIKSGTLNLGTLPHGLAGYYADYWGRWRADVAKWDAVYAPVLATLAAAQEPVSPDLLAAWGGVSEKPYAIKRRIDDHWGAFVRRGDDKRYSLCHASLRDFLAGDTARLQSVDEISGEMRDRTHEAHRRIVEHYRAQCDGNWPALAAADYARRYLALHLSGAERFDELFKLVAESNEWAEACYAKEESYAGYLLDLDRAWQWAESDSGWNIGRQIRCALIQSSIFSLAGNIPPELLVQLVEAKLWSPARALAHIPQMPDEEQQADALVKVISILPDTLKPEALAVARKMTDGKHRAMALSGLTEHLPEALRAEAAREALRAVSAISDGDVRARVLVKLAVHLPRELKVEALQLARLIRDDYSRAEALIGLIAYLPDDLKAHAVQVAWAIKDKYARAKTLFGLAAHVPEELRVAALRKALQAVWAMEEAARAEVMIELVAYLPEDLPEKLEMEVWRMASVMKDGRIRASILHRSTTHLSEEPRATLSLRSEATAVKYNSAMTLSKTTTPSPKSMKVATLLEALQTARRIKDNEAYAWLLIELVAHVPQGLKVQIGRKALRAARLTHSKETYAVMLCQLIAHLPDGLKIEAAQETLRAARTISDGDTLARVVSGLAPHLPIGLKRDAFQMAHSIRNKDARARALGELAVYLPGELKTQALQGALRAAKAIADGYRRTEALDRLIISAPEDIKAGAVRGALQAARTIRDKGERVRAISRLAAHLPQRHKVEAIREALQAARAIEYGPERVEAMSKLAAYLPEGLNTKTLKEIRTIWDENRRAEALCELAAYVPEELKAQAFRLAIALRNDSARAAALAGLALHLPDTLKSKALQNARTMQHAYVRTETLCRLAEHLNDDLQAIVFPEAFAAAREVGRPGR